MFDLFVEFFSVSVNCVNSFACCSSKRLTLCSLVLLSHVRWASAAILSAFFNIQKNGQHTRTPANHWSEHCRKKENVERSGTLSKYRTFILSKASAYLMLPRSDFCFSRRALVASVVNMASDSRRRSLVLRVANCSWWLLKRSPSWVAFLVSLTLRFFSPRRRCSTPSLGTNIVVAEVGLSVRCTLQTSLLTFPLLRVRRCQNGRCPTLAF